MKKHEFFLHEFIVRYFFTIYIFVAVFYFFFTDLSNFRYLKSFYLYEHILYVEFEKKTKNTINTRKLCEKNQIGKKAGLECLINSRTSRSCSFSYF